jgi:hypothetical protein
MSRRQIVIFEGMIPEIYYKIMSRRQVVIFEGMIPENFVDS